MSEFVYVWLYTVVLKFGNVAGVMLLVGLVAGIAAIIAATEGVDIRWSKKWFITWFSVIGVLLAVRVIIPSKSDLAWIIGGGTVLKLSQNEEVQQLPANLARIVNDFIETAEEEQ